MGLEPKFMVGTLALAYQKAERMKALEKLGYSL